MAEVDENKIGLVLGEKSICERLCTDQQFLTNCGLKKFKRYTNDNDLNIQAKNLVICFSNEEEEKEAINFLNNLNEKSKEFTDISFYVTDDIDFYKVAEIIWDLFPNSTINIYQYDKSYKHYTSSFVLQRKQHDAQTLSPSFILRVAKQHSSTIIFSVVFVAMLMSLPVAAALAVGVGLGAGAVGALAGAAVALSLLGFLGVRQANQYLKERDIKNQEDRLSNEP